MRGPLRWANTRASLAEALALLKRSTNQLRRLPRRSIVATGLRLCLLAGLLRNDAQRRANMSKFDGRKDRYQPEPFCNGVSYLKYNFRRRNQPCLPQSCLLARSRRQYRLLPRHLVGPLLRGRRKKEIIIRIMFHRRLQLQKVKKNERCAFSSFLWLSFGSHDDHHGYYSKDF